MVDAYQSSVWMNYPMFFYDGKPMLDAKEIEWYNNPDLTFSKFCKVDNAVPPGSAPAPAPPAPSAPPAPLAIAPPVPTPAAAPPAPSAAPVPKSPNPFASLFGQGGSRTASKHKKASKSNRITHKKRK